jgi:hypothetical protein
MAANRVQFRDVIPYEAPSSLASLRGPAQGMLEVPITVHWGPSRVFDLGEARQRRMVYLALVREGTPQVQEELLNETLLRREWAGLILPERCQVLWALSRTRRVTALRAS